MQKPLIWSTMAALLLLVAYARKLVVLPAAPLVALRWSCGAVRFGP